MPLIKSGSKAAISQNIREMVHAGHPQDQAVAAAMSTARRYGHAAGGGVQPPMGERYASRQLFHEGFLHSNVPGRTDKLPISVKGGAYVLPADHVAALGQGNSLAGADIVNKMFRMGPYGTALTGMRGVKTNAPHLNLSARGGKNRFSARGGSQDDGHTPIIAAGGEIVIPPDKIKERFGDLEHGHEALDEWVVNTRKKHIKTLRKLKPPRKD